MQDASLIRVHSVTINHDMFLFSPHDLLHRRRLASLKKRCRHIESAVQCFARQSRIWKRTIGVLPGIPNDTQLLRNLSRALLKMRNDPQLLGTHEAMRTTVRRFADWIEQVADQESNRGGFNGEGGRPKNTTLKRGRSEAHSDG
jgi:hypothetical protein